MIRHVALAALASLAGCDRILGIEDLRFADAEPPTFRIGGVVQGTRAGGSPSPLDRAFIRFITASGSELASTFSSSGSFELALPLPPGAALEGFLEAPFAVGSHRPGALYLPRPVTGDLSLVVDMFDVPAVMQIASLYGVTQDSISAAVFVRVVDAAGTPAAGVALQVMPPGPTVRYDDASGLPSATATQTGPNGRAFLFNVPISADLILSGTGAAGKVFGPSLQIEIEPTSYYSVTLNSAN